MIDVVFNKKVKSPFDEKTVKRIIDTAARQEKKIRGIVEVTLVGDKTMQELNNQYRGKDAPTDVLSFAWQEDKKIPSPMLGELFLDYPYIVRQSKRFTVSAEEECARMLVHGLLHIVGYDHVKKQEAEKMFTLQEKIVKKIKMLDII